MARETLYEIAYEMLQTTNVFDKDITEIRYTSMQDGELVEISLLNLVNARTRLVGHRYRGKSPENLQQSYECIANAIVDYLVSYRTVFSFKQKVKSSFKKWLDAISSKYDVKNNWIPEELKDTDPDLGITMLKLLHSREGVKYEDITKKLNGKSERSAQKYLVMLSPSLYNGPCEKSPYPPFTLGGYPLYADIENIGDPYEAKGKKFITRNTVHPLVLQQNIMQLATMLKSLCHQYEDYGDEMARIIAVDIWNQMSEYAQSKIKSYYAYDDSDLFYFIRAIDGACPDDHALYRKEKDYLLDDIERPIDMALGDLCKVGGRTATIILKSGKRIQARYVEQIINMYGEKAYRVTSPDGHADDFTKDQIESIHFN